MARGQPTEVRPFSVAVLAGDGALVLTRVVVGARLVCPSLRWSKSVLALVFEKYGAYF